MKKIFILFVGIFIATNVAFADGGTIKYFNTYEVINHKYSDLGQQVYDIIKSYTNEVQAVKGSRYTYYYTNPISKETYYARFYPNNTSTNVFIVSNEYYDKNDNDLTKLFTKLGYTYKLSDDKDAIREYKFDFYDLARKDSLGGFFIAPDCIKPLKSGMSKLNNAMAKNSKKTSALPYEEDTDSINLTLLDTTYLNDENTQISITQKEYRLKQKANKYVHAFEYTVKNNSDSSVLIKNVISERLAGTKDIATETFVDLDRLDLLDTIGTFPPVLICTAGVSALLSVPNWVRLARTTKEAVRYAHSLPENYTLKGNQSMRILVLKYKNNPKPLVFNLVRNGQSYQITF